MPESTVAVIIPALDEEASIGDVVRSLSRNIVREIIVVDNGSTDRTAEVARAAGARVVTEPVRGYGRACARGVASLPPWCTTVAFLDGDGSDAAEMIGEVIGPVVARNADFVLGSRTRGVRQPGSMSGLQVIAGEGAGIALHWLYGVRFTDMSPFRAIDRALLDELPMREMTYGWNLEMQILVARAGVRILEIPVAHYNRSGGVSKVSGNVRAAMVAATRIMRILARAALARPSHAASKTR